MCRLFFILACIFLPAVTEAAGLPAIGPGETDTTSGCDTAAGWQLTAGDSDRTPEYSGVAVGNGSLGMLPWKEPFSIRHVIMNNVFERQGDDGLNRIIYGICPFGITMYIDGKAVSDNDISDWSQTLDMKRAEHSTTFTIAGKARVEYSFMALRNLPFALMMTCRITASDDINVEISNKMTVPGGYRNSVSGLCSFMAESRHIDLLLTRAETQHGTHKVAASAMFFPDSHFSRSNHFSRGSISASGRPEECADMISASLKNGEAASFTLAGTICSTADFTDPSNESVRQIVYIDRLTPDKIIGSHLDMWENLWQSDIEIEGDAEAQQAVRLALYSLYSSCRKGSRLSIPPMGLSSTGYGGHIFWDSELWMFPPMLMMNTGIAKSMIDYRADRLDRARAKAYAYGYTGAMFPWESDGAGEEATPVWAITGPMEHHITADVAIAAWDYYCVTRDREWFEESGWPLIRSAAEFWESRASRNDDGTWSIHGVTGADEYANNVTDNAFTNGAVKKALQCAVKAGKVCGAEVPGIWKELSEGLRIIESPDGITLEYEGYSGEQIKQADVNLLGYPLGVITDRDRLLRDLTYYESRIDPVNGPAMSFSIFCVQYARLGYAEKAMEMFRKAYRPFQRPPFGAISETASSANPYFATGAGGLLQAVLNGFGGLRITDRGIIQKKPVLPPSWTRLTIKGVGPDRKTFTVTSGKIQ